VCGWLCPIRVPGFGRGHSWAVRGPGPPRRPLAVVLAGIFDAAVDAARCRITPYLDSRAAPLRGAAAALPAPRSALGAARAGAPPASRRSIRSCRFSGHVGRGDRHPRRTIVQLALGTSTAALRAVARDRLRRPLTRRALPRILAPAGMTGETRTTRQGGSRNQVRRILQLAEHHSRRPA